MMLVSHLIFFMYQSCVLGFKIRNRGSSTFHNPLDHLLGILGKVVLEGEDDDTKNDEDPARGGHNIRQRSSDDALYTEC